MKAYYITGGSGVKLFVEETGNPHGRSILFIHGTSQSRLSWFKQMNSDLAQEFRLVAMDIRGHGLSEKPYVGYDDSINWANDVQAVISMLNLQQPVLVAWSYAGLIVGDYLRVYGEKCISAVNLVSTITMIGTREADQFLSPQFRALSKGFITNDSLESDQTLQKYVLLCFNRFPSVYDYFFILGFNKIVPPYVREGMTSRIQSNNDLLPKIKLPVLITHGDQDNIVLLRTAFHTARLMPQAQMSLYMGVGHSPFWEEPIRFNEELKQFVRNI